MVQAVATHEASRSVERKLVDDRVTATGVKAVEMSADNTAAVLRVAMGDGSLRMVRMERVGSRIELRLHAEGVERDVSAQPAAGIRAIFLLASLPDVAEHATSEFARQSCSWLGEFDADDELQLLLAAHPTLATLRGRSAFTLASAIPEGVSAALRADTYAKAVHSLLPGRETGRSLLDAVAQSMVSSGHLRLREVSIAAAGQRLTDQDLQIVLQNSTRDAALSIIEPDTAAAASCVLSRLDRRAHRIVLVEAARERHGLRALRKIAAAGSQGHLDVTGVRGQQQLDWLLMRSAEALAEPAGAGPLANLNGKVLDSDGSRVRVVTSRQEFAHLGRTMSNCLATWGPASLLRGCVILAVVDATGSPRQAIEIAGDRVVQWEGPGRQAVPREERIAIGAALRAVGVRTGR